MYKSYLNISKDQKEKKDFCKKKIYKKLGRKNSYWKKQILNLKTLHFLLFLN